MKASGHVIMGGIRNGNLSEEHGITLELGAEAIGKMLLFPQA